MERRIVLREAIKKIEEKIEVKIEKLKRYDTIQGCYEIIFELIQIKAHRATIEERNQNKKKIKELEEKIKSLEWQINYYLENEKNKEVAKIKKEPLIKLLINRYILKI